MADEIKINKTITYVNGQLKYTYAPGTLSLPQATRGYVDQTVTATSVEADVTITVGSPGLCILRSLEATTTGVGVIWGTTAGLQFLLAPKRDAQFQFATSTGVLAVQTEGAVAASVKVQVLCFEA